MINYNGSLFDDGEKLFNGNNRAFRYGDGLFENMRVIDGKIPFFNYHFERLLRGMKVLKFSIPSYFNIHYLKNEVSKVIEDKPHSKVRLSLWRENGEHYMPITNDFDYLIEASHLVDFKYTFNDLGLTIGIFKDYKLHFSPFSAFKTHNALPYILAGLYAKENSFEDVLMLNTEGSVAEGIASNVFIVKEEKLYTPPLSSACIGGVMRTIIIEIASENGIEIHETPISIDSVRSADEVFFTNAIQGIRWVSTFENIDYQYDFALKLYNKLISKTTKS